ncbi:MAG: ADP-ribosylglycohydrolase family protein [Chloroflexota bacterium]
MNTNSTFYQKTVGCLVGGLIGDAIGTPTEGMDYEQIEARFGWVDDFDCDGTDDTVMKVLLAEALIRTDGEANYDDWAQVWLDQWHDIFGDKVGKFFQSVLHTAAKLKHHGTPRMAALGNMPSSSSAMCISPIGIVNACNPQAAANQAYSVASLIHTHDVSFCQDGAAAMATAVSHAFDPSATVGSILETAVQAITPISGQEMLGLIDEVLNIAEQAGEYAQFRADIYAQRDRFFRPLICDSRETIPITLAIFKLADGDFEKTVTYGANFGRDADTIATMGGAIAGAYQGINGIRSDWVTKANDLTQVNQAELAEKLIVAAKKKFDTQTKSRETFRSILGRDS